MKWRKWNNIIHRDLGYLCFGLTIIYVISGVAVNHIATWNPTYKISHETTSVQMPEDFTGEENLVNFILAELGENGELKGIFQPSPDSLQIFVENNTITADLKTGEVRQEKNVRRPFLFQMNFLHLNHPKKFWTWFADLYAIALGFLAITGLFILRGRNGMRGRGSWLVSAGLVIPIFFLWLYG
jgi:hypothetical protein